MNYFGGIPVLGGSGSKASPEAQIKYMQALLLTNNDKIQSLEMELKALSLERKVETNKFERHINSLELMRDDYVARVKTKPWEMIITTKKPWYKRIFTNEIRDKVSNK